MKKCKWTGDMSDEYCKSCNGITMEVDGNSISCKECAGYEESDEDVESATEKTEEPMTESTKDNNEDDSQSSNVENVTNDVEETTQISTKAKKTNNNTSNKEKGKNEAKNKANTVTKVSEEAKETEVKNDIKVTSLRYTSGATVKKGDNYFKFVAEEEWDVSRIEDVQEAREKLWAKLNAEVDSQIEELNNMN